MVAGTAGSGSPGDTIGGGSQAPTVTGGDIQALAPGKVGYLQHRNPGPGNPGPAIEGGIGYCTSTRDQETVGTTDHRL